MKKKNVILVTNDDGILAPGIRALIHVMSSLGEVYVVAPAEGKSGKSHSVSVEYPLRCESVKLDNGPQREWRVSGTPADCVKLAIDHVLPKPPNICVSGINHGTNASLNVLYSGTVSAAVEAALSGIPGIGFSLLDDSSLADFSAAQYYAENIVKKALNADFPREGILNVNIPKLAKEQIKGIKICRQSKGAWRENFEKRADPKGRPYYWLTGKYTDTDPGSDHDHRALEEGYVSIVPISFDRTDYKLMKKLDSWNL
ncbi:5'/3'-nucleotidase SurE [Bacteroidetes bacterium endosymbiont of Geopemphigus sp.]|uniref:5'/3'-nucleotidase SurE n=1 Tax=Bacteroidetes bacterium endosymbiont of Geopemphigus sp. TaxID=2047937 RepID=UPI000CD2017E|nr:5'/3'-nucleotidase SurE [Bacteroidetes bacterium endosymbiont of Geopemphigus sp.]